MENIKVKMGDYGGERHLEWCFLIINLEASPGNKLLGTPMRDFFYNVLIEVNRLTLNVGTPFHELDSQIKQEESKLSTSIYFFACRVWTQCE